MGAFDDLIPDQAPASTGAFDDLIPKQVSPVEQTNAFDDLIPKVSIPPAPIDAAPFKNTSVIAPPDDQPSIPGVLARSAARNVLPTAGFIAAAGPGRALGAAAGARTGALLGALVPGLGETGISEGAGAVIGGLIGMFGAGTAAATGTKALQTAAADKLAPDSFLGTKSEQEDVNAHPIASELGSLAVIGKPNPFNIVRAARTIGSTEGRAALKDLLATGATKEGYQNWAQNYSPDVQKAAMNVLNVAQAGGINAAFNAYDQIKSGNYSATDLLRTAAEGALFNEPWIHAKNPATAAFDSALTPDQMDAAKKIITLDQNQQPDNPTTIINGVIAKPVGPDTHLIEVNGKDSAVLQRVSGDEFQKAQNSVGASGWEGYFIKQNPETGNPTIFINKDYINRQGPIFTHETTHLLDAMGLITPEQMNSVVEKYGQGIAPEVTQRYTQFAQENKLPAPSQDDINREIFANIFQNWHENNDAPKVTWIHRAIDFVRNVVGLGKTGRATAQDILAGKFQESAAKQPDPNWQVTVQPDELDNGVKIPSGYVQIDDVTGGQNVWSKSPKTLAEEGVDVPDFSNLPKGQYTYADAVKLLKLHGGQASLPKLAFDKNTVSAQDATDVSQTEDRGGAGISPAPEGLEAGRPADSGTPARPGAEPNPAVREAANRYNETVGLQPTVPHYAPVDELRARQIAEEYNKLPKFDKSPQTIAAYEQLGREIQQQWDYAINKMGITFEAWTKEGQPYANSREMVKDVRDNHHLYFFTGGEEHPLLNVKDDHGLTLNDKLRAIHDLYGHAAEDFQFGARGEENAWIKHSQMFSPLAQKALTTETRGQNSWVNYGAHNYDEAGVRKNIKPQDRPFADQKVALLPEWAHDWKGALNEKEKPKAQFSAAKAEDDFSDLQWWKRRDSGDEATDESRIKPSQAYRLNKVAGQQPNGYVQIHRWAHKFRDVIDPAFHGKGIAGEEARRKAQFPSLYLNRTYFGLRGYKKEQGLGLIRQDVSIHASRLYDIDNDPLNFYERAADEGKKLGQGSMNIALFNTIKERMIVAAGFHGYYSNAHKIATMFKPVAGKGKVAGVMRDATTQPENYSALLKSKRISHSVEGFKPGTHADMTPEELISSAQRVRITAPSGTTALRVIDSNGNAVIHKLSKFSGENPLFNQDIERISPVSVKTSGIYRGQTIPVRGSIKVQPTAMFSVAKQSEESPIWRNNIEDALGTWQAKGTPEQLMAHLAKFRGTKDQADWIGLDDFLSGKTSVTKSEVEDFVRANKVDLKEVVKGVPETLDPKQAAWTEKLNANDPSRKVWTLEKSNVPFAQIYEVRGGKFDLSTTDGDGFEHTGRFDDLQNAKFVAEQKASLAQIDSTDETKFEIYQTPGGSNYRELLLTLPEKGKAVKKIQYQLWDKGRNEQIAVGDAKAAQRWRDNFRPDRDEIKEVEVWDSQASNKQGNFISTHFDEPNIVGHIRFNERDSTTPENPTPVRTMHLEELQSDWHQKGRKEGYQNDTEDLANKDKVARRKVVEAELQKMIEAERQHIVANYDVPRSMLVSSVIANDLYSKNQNFKSLRDELDTLPHATQRFDGHKIPNAPFKTSWPMLLFKRALRYAADNGFKRITWTTGEQQADRYDLSHHVDRISYNPKTKLLVGRKSGDGGNEKVFDETLEPSKLEDFIGKDAAQKILSKEIDKNGWQTISGDDLKVGGGGMKGFYDKILPSEVNKFLKRYGAKVGEARINAMSLDDAAERIYGRGEKFESLPENERKRAALVAGESGDSVHSLDITPELEKAAAEGLPMFSVTKKGKFYEGKRFGDVKDEVVPELPPLHPLPVDQFKQARDSIMRLAQAVGTINARGMTINFANPDPITARKLGVAPDSMTARAIHAISDPDRRTPNANKILLAPMIENTIRQADFVTKIQRDLHDDSIDATHYGRAFMKLYDVDGQPVWHLVETDDRGNFITQYSWPQSEAENGRVMRSQVLQVGPRVSPAGAPGEMHDSGVYPQAEAPISHDALRSPTAAPTGQPEIATSGKVLQPQFSVAKDRAQVGGIKGVGEERDTESISDNQSHIRERLFDGTKPVSDENTSAAWQVFDEMTGKNRSQIAGQLRDAFGGSRLLLGLYKGEVWKYARKLAINGDDSLLRAMYDNSEKFETLAGGGASSAGSSLRAEAENANDPVNRALQNAYETERENAANSASGIDRETFTDLLKRLRDLELTPEEVEKTVKEGKLPNGKTIEEALDELTPESKEAMSLLDKYQRSQTEWLKPDVKKSIIRVIVDAALGENKLARYDEKDFQARLSERLQEATVPKAVADELAFEVWKDKAAREATKTDKAVKADAQFEQKRAQAILDKLQTDQTEQFSEARRSKVADIVKAFYKNPVASDEARSAEIAKLEKDLVEQNVKPATAKELAREAGQRKTVLEANDRLAQEKITASEAQRTAEGELKKFEEKNSGVEWLKEPSQRSQVLKLIEEALKSKSPILDDPTPIVNDTKAKLVTAGVDDATAGKLAFEIETVRRTQFANRRVAAMETAAKSKNIRSLIESILETPYRAQSDPKWLQETAIRWFESNGLGKDQAEAASRLFQNQFREALAAASKKIAQDLLAKGSPKSYEGLWAMIRAGIFDPSKNWVDQLAEKTGWKKPTVDQMKKLQELEHKLTNPELSPEEVASINEQQMHVLRHVGKKDSSAMRALGESFTASLLSGIRTMTVQSSPFVMAFRDLPIMAASDPKNTLNFAKAMFNAFKANAVTAFKFAWMKDAYGFHLNDLEHGFNEMKRISEETDDVLKSGKSTPTQKGSAYLKKLYALQRYVFRTLNSVDQAAMSVTREWKLAYYSAQAFKEAGLSSSDISQLIDSIEMLRRNEFEKATEQGLDQATASIRANSRVKDIVWDFVNNKTGNSRLADQVLAASENDAYSTVGRTPHGMSSSDEGMLSRFFPMNDFLQFVSKVRGKGGLHNIGATALLGMINIPFRTTRYFSDFSPYGLLRYGIYKYRTNRGKENYWKQSYGNALQARARLYSALAGTTAMVLGTAWALNNNTTNEKSGDEDFALYITGKGPDNKVLADAWAKRGFKQYSANFVLGGHIISIPLTRAGESLLFPFIVPAALDDFAWKKKEAQAAGHPIKDELSAFSSSLVGEALSMTGQSGILQTFGQLQQATQNGGSLTKAFAKVGIGAASSVVVPFKQLLASISEMFYGSLDSSSVSALIANQFPIIGLPWQHPALNRFGDPMYDRSWYGLAARTGIPLVFQIDRTAANEKLYTTLVDSGAAPPPLSRSNIEKQYGELTDDQFKAFATTSGQALKQSVQDNLDAIKNMSPEDARKFLAQLANKANQKAAQSGGLERQSASAQPADGSAPVSKTSSKKTKVSKSKKAGSVYRLSSRKQQTVGKKSHHAKSASNRMSSLYGARTRRLYGN